MWMRRLRLPVEQLLSFLNLFLFAIVAMCLILTCLLSSKNFEDLPYPPQKQEKMQLPKNPFAQPVESYEKIGEGPFSLRWVAPQLQLPDLRNELSFLGKNERPDVPKNSQLFHLYLKGSGETCSVRSSEKIYLFYQGNIVSSGGSMQRHIVSDQIPIWSETSHHFSKGTYSFSPGNQPTPLWIQLSLVNAEALEVSLNMLDEKGCIIESPEEHRSFILTRNESTKLQRTNWEIGGQRVDTTLLVRQKARWIGPDLFLETFGGDEFAFMQGGQRLDFMEEELPYTCFVKEGDFLIWEDGHWCTTTSEENTLEHPLLVIKKIEDKVMVLDLWDTEGKTKLTMSLIKGRDYDPLPLLEHEFKFVGAKTWAQFIVECRNQRLILKPHDWLILTKEGWHKINSPQEVDDFVNQKITGPLFVLEKMIKKNGRQALVGHLFNTSRTEMQEIELPAVQSPLLNAYPPSITLPPSPLKAGTVQELKDDEP